MSISTLFRDGARTAALGLLLPLACATTKTHTVTLERPAVSRLALARPESKPLVGAFRQEGHAVVGTVGFTRECSVETTRTFDKTEVSETKASGETIAAYIAVGAGLAAAGTGLLFAARGKSDDVWCGDGAEPRAGDTCQSEAHVYSTLGVTLLVSGLGSAAVGGVLFAQKPKSEAKALDPERVVSTSGSAACGLPESLAGTVLGLELPNGSRWTGRVDASGAARIELSSDIAIPDAEVAIFVDEVPLELSALLARGSTVSSVSLSRTAPVRAR